MMQPRSDAISYVETYSQDEKKLATFIMPDRLCRLYMTSVMKLLYVMQYGVWGWRLDVNTIFQNARPNDTTRRSCHLRFPASCCSLTQHGQKEEVSDIIGFYQELQVQICVICDLICGAQWAERRGNG